MIEDREARTNRLIADMLIALTGEESYEVAMNGMLQMVAEILKPDRLSVFECGHQETRVSFELRSDGFTPNVGEVYQLPLAVLQGWIQRSVKGGSMVMVPDTAVIEGFSKPLYDWCVANNFKCMMVAPFRNNGEVVGFLGAYNYHLSEEIDIEKLFAAVSSFIGARMDNQHLINDLNWAGEHDTLTKLLNRRGFDLALEERLAKDPRGPYTLALIDLDDFKKINDSYGHAVGDEALRGVARAMTETFPEDAIMSRNGGDEFLAVIPGEGTPEVDELVHRFAEAGVDYGGDGKQHHLTLSVGYACYPEHAENYRELYPRADTALYSVKLAGKSGALRFSPEVDMRFRSQLSFVPSDLAENVSCGIAVHMAGKKGVVLYANKVLMQMIGYDNTSDFMERFGGMFWGIVHPDDRENARNILAEHAANDEIGAITTAKFRIITKEGEERNALASGRLVELEGVGKVFYTIVVDLGK